MAVQYYSSEDAGAPQYVVTRNVSANYENSIIEIMDAVLVNGYGSKPGMGWTKEMTTEVTDSNRTVYKNKSAHADDMFLIIQTHKHAPYGIQVQIADLATSPEQYSGYSNVASLTFSRNTTHKWLAVGDERTLIFIYWSTYLEATSISNWDSYYPIAFYAGDFDVLNNSNPKGWGLLAPGMYAGTLDTVGNVGANRGIMNFDNSGDTTASSYRFLTQVPGEEWSENGGLVLNSSFESSPTVSNKLDRVIATTDEMAAKAQIRSGWFISYNRDTIYRLRGIYNIYPWLALNDESVNRNWGEVFNVFNDDYIAYTRAVGYADNYFSPLTIYIKLSGDW